MSLVEMGTHFGSAIVSLLFAWVMYERYFPYQLRSYVDRYSQKLVGLFYPYHQITFHEYSDERFKLSDVFCAIRSYLSSNSSTRAKRLKADVVKDTQSVLLTMDDHEEITDDFKGIKVWWGSRKSIPKSQSFYFYPHMDDKRFFRLTFHKRYREIIVKSYIDHVIKEGKAIAVKNRQRKLYTNNPSKNWYGWRSTKWNHVLFEHPASFDSLAMATKEKEEIKNDLMKFSQGKNYYAKIGKAWKRGYLLYGPPGTGKSTMIAAMANLLNYDIYDLELTTVLNNSELRNLLIETTSKSIIVIEDIDCSLDLTGQRKPKEKKAEEEEEEEKEKKEEPEKKKTSEVTLSGLLNVIDGIWSACGGERIIIFTTNYVEKLDPALIRRGRMDKHIEMSYCCFEAFKVLAKNYLDIESHQLFAKVQNLLEEMKMTAADVAENLMPKSENEDEEACLKKLIAALEETKEEEARKKSEEEAKLKEQSIISGNETKENGFIPSEGKKESSL